MCGAFAAEDSAMQRMQKLLMWRRGWLAYFLMTTLTLTYLSKPYLTLTDPLKASPDPNQPSRCLTWLYPTQCQLMGNNDSTVQIMNCWDSCWLSKVCPKNNPAISRLFWMRRHSGRLTHVANIVSAAAGGIFHRRRNPFQNTINTSPILSTNWFLVDAIRHYIIIYSIFVIQSSRQNTACYKNWSRNLTGGH